MLVDLFVLVLLFWNCAATTVTSKEGAVELLQKQTVSTCKLHKLMLLKLYKKMEPVILRIGSLSLHLQIIIPKSMESRQSAEAVDPPRHCFLSFDPIRAEGGWRRLVRTLPRTLQALPRSTSMHATARPVTEANE